MRKTVRDAAWRKPGWDECVAHTGNLNHILIVSLNYFYDYIFILSHISAFLLNFSTFLFVNGFA